MAENRVEYIVKKDTSLIKVWLILGYILFPFAELVVLFSLLYGNFLIIPGCVMAVGLEVLLIFFSWRFTHVEYETCIEYNTLTLTAIRAKMHRKLLIELDIKSINEAGLFTAEASETLEERTLHKDYVFISSLKSQSIYYAVFSEGEDICVLYFETSEDGFSQIKKHNLAAVRRGEISQKNNKTGEKQ